VVQSQDHHGRSAFWSQASNHRFPALKVFVPLHLARMKQHGFLTGLGIEAS
jgi:hypothetical protein